MKIILASASPRRKEILKNLGLDFEIISSDCDENIPVCSPKKLVCELSKIKARSVYNDYSGDKTDTLFIAADTIVCIKNKILGKPKDESDAAKMLGLLSGNKHSVITGVTLIYNEKTITDFEKTDVLFAKLTKAQIDDYIKSGEPNDKAGGYAVQGLASKYIKKINGDYFNVVGLPTRKLYEMAQIIGITL